MKTYIFIGLCICVLDSAHAQNSGWTASIAGKAEDCAEAIGRTADGCYVLAGALRDGLESSAFLAKVDSTGHVVWSYRELGSRSSAFKDVCITVAGEIVAAGVARDSCGNDDVLAVRLDSAGMVLSSAAMRDSGIAVGQAVMEAADGNLAIAGWRAADSSTNEDMCLVRINGGGEQIATHSYGSSGDESAVGICEVGTGFVIAGTVMPQGKLSSEICLVRTDTMGNTLWWQTYGGRGDYTAHDLLVTRDGGYLIAGKRPGGRYYGEIVLIKTDASGVLEWDRAFAQREDSLDRVRIRPTHDGYLAAAYHFSFGGGPRRMQVFKTDVLGELLWTSYYDGNGFSQWGRRGGYWMADSADPFGKGLADFFGFPLCGDDPYFEIKPKAPLPRIRPRHFKTEYFSSFLAFSFCLPRADMVTLTILDSHGHALQTVHKGRFDEGEHVIPFDGSPLARGIYFAAVESSGLTAVKKFVVMK